MRGRTVQQAKAIAERQERAVELRGRGWSFFAIARELGYSGPGAAFKAVEGALAKIPAGAVQALRAQSGAHLDDLIREAWAIISDRLLPPDTRLKAIVAAGQLQTRKDRLNGVIAPPMTVENNENFTVIIDATVLGVPDDAPVYSHPRKVTLWSGTRRRCGKSWRRKKPKEKIMDDDIEEFLKGHADPEQVLGALAVDVLQPEPDLTDLRHTWDMFGRVLQARASRLGRTVPVIGRAASGAVAVWADPGVIPDHAAGILREAGVEVIVEEAAAQDFEDDDSDAAD